jgi:ATP-dependent Zn protease
MKNKLFILLFAITFICSITFISSLYVGESQVYSNELQKDNLVWTIIENTSNISILPEITINLTNITIYLPTNMPPNSFKIVFLEESTNTIVQTIPVYQGGGGHSRTINKIINNTIEVPNYINNETIKYIENKTIETIYKEIKPPTLLGWIIGIILILLVIGILFYFMKRQEKRWKKEEELNKGTGDDYEDRYS